MYYDIESEFWKEHFVHLLHKNMVRTNAEKIEFKNIKFQFDDFERKYPELKPQVDFAENYCTWEIFVTPQIKLRLFIHNSVKGSLLEFSDGEYVKIADAKFPYNPFPEIEEFLLHVKEYEQEFDSLLKKSVYDKRQVRIAKEFIKAYLCVKLKKTLNAVWSLEESERGIKLLLECDSRKNEFELSVLNFKSELEKIFSDLLLT